MRNEAMENRAIGGHVPVSQLALYSRGDLGFWRRRGVERHVVRCEECAGQVREFVQATEILAEAATELPPELSNAAWRFLASEMTANIRLGIAAGECVATRPVMSGRPRLTLALAGMAVVLVLAVLEHPRLGPAPVAHAPGAVLEPMAADAGRMLSISAPAGQAVIQTVNMRGDMRSRIVDDTGVTIYDVYASAE